MAVMLGGFRQAILIALVSIISVFKYSQTLPVKGELNQEIWYNKYSECPYPVSPIVANKTSHVGEMCDLQQNKKWFIVDACSTLVNVSDFICTSNVTIPKNASFILDPDAIHRIVENGSVCNKIRAEENQTWTKQIRTQLSFLYKLKTEPDFCDVICGDKNTTYLCVLLLNGLQIMRNMQASKVSSNSEKKVPDQQEDLHKPQDTSPIEGKGGAANLGLQKSQAIPPVDGKGGADNQGLQKSQAIPPMDGKGAAANLGLPKTRDKSPVEGKGGGVANILPNRDKPKHEGDVMMELDKPNLNIVEAATTYEILTTTLNNKSTKEASSPNNKNSAFDNSELNAFKPAPKILSNNKIETTINEPVLPETVQTDNKNPLSMPKPENKQQKIVVTEKIVTTTPTTLPKYDTSINSQLEEVNKDNSDSAQITNTIQENSGSNKKVEPIKTDAAETTKDAATLKDLERKDFEEENAKTDAPEGSNTKPIDDDSFGEEDNDETLGEQQEDIINPDKGQSIRRGGGGVDGQDMDTEFTEFSGYTDSHFFSYILTISVLCIIVYLIFHNKQKILAIIIEGKNKQRRRPNTSNYKKLDSNVEEVMHRPASAVTTAHIIY